MPLVDVHTHWLPQTYLNALKKAGIKDVEGFPLPSWDEARHLDMMARQGIATGMLSISAPGIQFLKGSKAKDLAREINEEAAKARERTGGRFGGFAMLPLPDVDDALREMEYALDVLHLDGIGLLTNINGVYLGDKHFDPVFAEADKRGAVIYTHPVAPLGYEAITLGFSASSLEYPFDTTRMILNLIATGTLRRHKKLKLITSHGGGTMPFLGWRMANVSAMFNHLTPKMTPQEAHEQMESLYCDSTAISNAVSLASFKLFVKPERRLFGSDFPFMPETDIPDAHKALITPGGLPDSEVEALEHGNARHLFPRVAWLTGEKK